LRAHQSRWSKSGRLNGEDALQLIRDHQTPQDPARLSPNFSSPAEEDAARAIVELLDGYTLAVEQAAVYLGSSGIEPSELLAVLQAQGTAVLDAVGSSAAGADAILNNEKLAAAIVDETLRRLPLRARASLAMACVLPLNLVVACPLLGRWWCLCCGRVGWLGAGQQHREIGTRVLAVSADTRWSAPRRATAS
jgi:hypothetical protein